jgi:hypothetical protein
MKNALTLTLSLLCGCQPGFADGDDLYGTDSGPVEDSGSASSSQAVYINEFMPSNGSILFEGMPEDYTPDWIELYNATDTPINLAGWTITDDLEEPERHVLSNLGLEPGGYLLLFADGDPDEGPEHLEFKLDADGESVGLYSPDGAPVDRLEYTDMLTDLSVARVPDGGSLAGTYDSTPGESNPTEVSD